MGNAGCHAVSHARECLDGHAWLGACTARCAYDALHSHKKRLNGGATREAQCHQAGDRLLVLRRHLDLHHAAAAAAAAREPAHHGLHVHVHVHVRVRVRVHVHAVHVACGVWRVACGVWHVACACCACMRDGVHTCSISGLIPSCAIASGDCSISCTSGDCISCLPPARTGDGAASKGRSRRRAMVPQVGDGAAAHRQGEATLGAWPPCMAPRHRAKTSR